MYVVLSLAFNPGDHVRWRLLEASLCYGAFMCDLEFVVLSVADFFPVALIELNISVRLRARGFGFLGESICSVLITP